MLEASRAHEAQVRSAGILLAALSACTLLPAPGQGREAGQPAASTCSRAFSRAGGCSHQ